MSDENKVARPYAKAVFAVACQASTLDEWAQALSYIAEAVKQPELNAWLKAPTTQVQQVLDWFVGLDKALFTAPVQRYIETLYKRDRLEVTPHILAFFLRYRAEAEKLSNVKMSSAHKVDSDLTAKLQSALEQKFGQKVSIETQICADLIGGAVLECGDILIDGSVKGQLKRVADALEVV